MQRFRGGLVFKAHRLCVSLNSGLKRNKEEEDHLGRGGESLRLSVASKTTLLEAASYTTLLEALKQRAKP